uniref:Nucleotide-diphospho-sugar transferase domain-containing protein n=1 Tax=Pseudo-nitzschia australis TaxID=44445 RepID=A0A7S4AKP5_9STRA|mmetsp:Transcript_19218/g.41767  ORF Transcript_19218/g.41767 Transcript_19218/m.41767 type:complete len:593 (+) Transcript_19218:118-1896(+)
MKAGAKLRSSNSRSKGLSLSAIISHLLAGIGGIYVGLTMGLHTCHNVPDTDASMIKMTAKEWRAQSNEDIQSQRLALEALTKKGAAPNKKSTNKFPAKVQKVVYDYATVSRDKFNELIEVGVPMDDSKKGSEEVVVLYTDPKTLPYESGKGKNAKRIEGPKEGMDVEKALENCGTLKVILQQPASPKKTQCIAIVPQWESYHVHKFMRLSKTFSGNGVDASLPLRYVGRGMMENGKEAPPPSSSYNTKPALEALVDYVKALDTSLNELRPVVKEAVEKHKKDKGISKVMKKSKTVVVMVCNKGQAHLFHNFVCNARARGLDLSRIIMFATDMYTAKLSQDLGISVFYDEAIFGKMPERAARAYGDRTFSQMMMAKVYCVHLIISLGYDVLFQDVDVVWHENPLEYLETEESKEWDMIFQDDGSRQVRYQPYSPNTGFYFVRNNELTTYFFNSLVKMGDLVTKSKSHQAALTALMAEFVSWKGLRVKVWKRGGKTLFPGGYEYHQGKDYMRQFIAGKIKPFIFHMSWTENKDNKKLYYEQMAEWYTKDESSGCKGLDCCAAEPIITCHYKDKPSFVPCKDSPPIDKRGKSFWK